MSKFAVRVLSLCLHEASRATPGVRVCLIVPPALDTPMFDRAANHVGHRLRAIPPAVSAERVAATIVRTARRPRRQRTVGASGAFLAVAHRLQPRLTETAVARWGARFVTGPALAGDSSGTLFGGGSGGRTSGGFRRGAWRARIGDAVGRRLAR